MNIKIDDVFAMKDGTALRIEEYDYPAGGFVAQVRSMTSKEWTEYRLQGEAIKLPMFLKQNGAVKE